MFRHVDMLAGDLMTITPDATHRLHLADVAALVRRRRSGGYVMAAERGFLLLDDELRVERSLPVFTDPGVRMNEGACDAAGRLFCGSMAYDAQPGAGTLFRLDPDLSIHVAREGVSIPNGLAWDPAGTTAFHADTGEDAVHAYDYDVSTGTFGARRTFISFRGEEGSPDGMAMDVEGGLWIAMWGGRAVRRYDSSGALTEIVELPVTNVTSCAFGGEDGRTLLITTSRVGVRDGAERHAGDVILLDVGVEGAPVHQFGG